jgi:hypothetical protein
MDVAVRDESGPLAILGMFREQNARPTARGRRDRLAVARWSFGERGPALTDVPRSRAAKRARSPVRRAICRGNASVVEW